MSNAINKDLANKVVATNVSCIKAILEKALAAVTEADDAAAKGERNLAIGCLLDIEAGMASAKALYDATLYMHRNAL